MTLLLFILSVSGVPQATLSGPALLKYVVSDLHTVIPDVKFVTVCSHCRYNNGRSTSQTYRFTDVDIRKSSCECVKNKNKLGLNKLKDQEIVISFGKTPELQLLEFDEYEIEGVNTIKLLIHHQL